MSTPFQRAAQMTAKYLSWGMWIPVVFVVRDNVGCFVHVEGRSMCPTLNPSGSRMNDWLLLNKLNAKDCSNYKRGDVVIFRSPLDPDKILVKRLVAKPGDWLRVKKTDDDSAFTESVQFIPQGRCWVEGDNQTQSKDSRKFGPLPIALLEGKASHLIWPPWRFGLLESVVEQSRFRGGFYSEPSH